MRCGVTGKRSSSARSLRRARIPGAGQHRPRRSAACLRAGRRAASRGADVADHLGMRVVDLFDGRGLVATWMTSGPPALFIRKGGFSTRVVADGDDQVGALDGLVDVVALRERGGAHVEVGAAGDGALAHLRVEEGHARARTNFAKRRSTSAAGSQRRRSSPAAAGREDHVRRAVERGGAGDGNSSGAAE
jgi:hypothetical protein